MAVKTSQTKFPQTINQPQPADNRVHWKNTNNLKTKSTNLNTNYAQTNLIHKTTGTKPYIERLQLLNFQFQIPEYAIITRIEINYSYRLEAQVANKYPTIAAPTFMIKNSGMKENKKNGETPTKNWKSKSLAYSGNYYVLPSAKTINSPNFGMDITFPKNTSDNEGYIFINNVSITVSYTIPEFPVDLAMIGDDNGKFVKDRPFRIQTVVNNPDLSDTPPTVELTVPTGTTLTFAPDSISSDTLTKISDTKYQLKLARWGSSYETINTGGTTYNVVGGTNVSGGSITIDTSKGSRTIDLYATVPSTGNKTFTITETRGNKTQSRSVTVIAEATPVYDDTDVPMEQAIYAVQNVPFTLPVKIPPNMVGETIYLYTDTGIKVLKNSVYNTVSDWFTIPSNMFDSEGNATLTCKTSNTGIINISITNDNTSTPEQQSFVVRVVPEGYEAPRFTVLKLSQEESYRLGHTYHYTVSADMRINCLTSSIPAFVDYYRNFRIGVVNEIPTTLDMDVIFNACRNWSHPITVFNEFENKSVEFVYNEDYPVYIIITGNHDTIACNQFECEFGNLQLIESIREDGNEVIFPRPIRNTIDVDDETISQLELPANNVSNNLIFYKLGLDGFQGQDNLAIRGIEVRVTANSDSSSVISVQLKSPQGFTGERSVLIDHDPIHILGGSSDRWGFDISELAELPSFELEMNIQNLAGADNIVNIEKIEFITYFIFYEKQVVDWFIEGENMAGFNVFLQDQDVPPGLETATKYLNVSGTDTNVAYRQNIKEKDIEVEFSIDECNIEEATATLQDVTEHLLTERDKIYRPILKRLEFSNYPGIYWEYMMEKPIDTTFKGSSIDCKVKLTVPSGTAYTKDEITTGSSGRVSGLAKVNPTIIVRPTADSIELEETFTNQKFMMSYDSFTSADLVEIDCRNRKIYLRRGDENIDITNTAADWDTDWFLLYDQFLFTETGCVIQSITWNERK